MNSDFCEKEFWVCVLILTKLILLWSRVTITSNVISIVILGLKEVILKKVSPSFKKIYQNYY